MRQKSYTTRYFDFSGESSVKVAQDYRNKYEALSDILDANPALLELAHRDWCELLSNSDDGRGSRYSSEQLLRALVVMFVENEDYRGTIVRIDTSEVPAPLRSPGGSSHDGFHLLEPGLLHALAGNDGRDE